MERVELIEDLDVRSFRAQGTVDAGGFTRTFTASCLEGVSAKTALVGFRLVKIFSRRFSSEGTRESPKA